MKLSSFLSVAIGCLGLLIGSSGSSQATKWGEGYLPNSPVVTQNGDTLRFYDDVIKGKIVVISFIYTSCRDICPVVTARLAQVQDKLGELADHDISFVSISIDPVTDTPAKLKNYAAAFGISKNWLFLTGEKEDMDILRYKLGERSRMKSEHGNTILIYNDATNEWSRDSAFQDLNLLAATIRTSMPKWNSGREVAEAGSGSVASPARIEEAAADLPGQNLFIKTCAACHTLGHGDRVGPDLSGLATRRTRDWIVSYLVNPAKLRAEADPAAVQLAAQYPSVRMPNLSLSENDANDLIGFMEAMNYADAADKANPHAHHHH